MPAVRIAIEICGDVHCNTPTLQSVQPKQQRRRTESASCAASQNAEVMTIAVTVPSLVDGPQANLLADILITQVDTVASNSGGLVSSLSLQKCLMTPEVTHGVLLFLAIHAHSMTQVSFQHLIQVDTKELLDEEGVASHDNGETDSSADTDLTVQMMARVAEALATAPLERLELTHMVLSDRVWQHWTHFSQLTMLKLDHVTLNDSSLQSLYEQLTCWPSLQDLYVVLLNTQLSALGLDAADKILTACSRGGPTLSSLRWVYRYTPQPHATQFAEFGTPTNKCPMTGLRELVAQNNTLQQLVLEGCLLNDHEVGQLCSVVSELKSLLNLKLRNLQLSNAHTQTLARALFHAQAPIVNMDWSGNLISQSGLQSIMELVATLTSTIQSLYLNSNQINRECFNTIIDFLQTHGLADIDLRLQYNPYDAERIAPLLALALWEAERDRDKALKSLKETQDQRDKAQKDMERLHRSDSSRFLKLEQENSQLKEELSTMIKAYQVMGSLQGADEHRQLLDRIARLEDIVLSRGEMSRQNSGRSSRQSSGRDLGSRQGSSQELVLSRQGSNRDLGARQGSSRDLSNWQASHSHDVLQTPQSVRRPMAPNLMETPREDRRPAMPIKTKSPDSSASNIVISSSTRRRPPSAAKSADAGVLHRMQRSGSSRRITDSDDGKGDSRLRSTGSRRPMVVRSASANMSIALEDVSPQPEVLTNMSGHDVGVGPPRRISSESRRPTATAALHQSYSGFSSTTTALHDAAERVHQSYNGFSGNWELDDVKETPYEDTE